MERLTERSTKDSYWHVKGLPMFEVQKICHDILYNVVERLAAYEDTGLTPDEIRVLCNMYNRSTMAKMLRWGDADDDGRLVIFPCKKGDRLFVLAKDSPTGIEETKCKGIVIKSRQDDGLYAKVIAPCVYDDNGDMVESFYSFYPEAFGKTVFLTRAEAEAALEKKRINS